jgi:hypothetical protein
MSKRKILGTNSPVWVELKKLLEDLPDDRVRTLPSTWTRKQKAGLVIGYLHDTIWVHNIVRALNSGAHLAALTLSLSIIDYLGGYLNPSFNYERRYVAFIEEYVAKHGSRATAIYRDLRGAFLHNLVLTTPDPKRTGSHFLLTAFPSGGSITWDYGQGVHDFSIADFAQEVIDGAARYLTDVIKASEGDDIAKKFEERFDYHNGEASIVFVRDWGSDEDRWQDRRYFSDFKDPIEKMRDRGSS